MFWFVSFVICGVIQPIGKMETAKKFPKFNLSYFYHLPRIWQFYDVFMIFPIFPIAYKIEFIVDNSIKIKICNLAALRQVI